MTAIRGDGHVTWLNCVINSHGISISKRQIAPNPCTGNTYNSNFNPTLVKLGSGAGRTCLPCLEALLLGNIKGINC